MRKRGRIGLLVASLLGVGLYAVNANAVYCSGSGLAWATGPHSVCTGRISVGSSSFLGTHTVGVQAITATWGSVNGVDGSGNDISGCYAFDAAPDDGNSTSDTCPSAGATIRYNAFW